MSGMTRKEAIKNLKELLKWYLEEEMLSETVYKREAVDLAISALSEELSEDGTLTVHVSDGSKVKRVFVMGDNIYGGLYYPDSAENKGEWIDISTGRGIFKDRSVKCSNCRNTLNLDGVNCGRGDANYCPNCGADMRKPIGEKGKIC